MATLADSFLQDLDDLEDEALSETAETVEKVFTYETGEIEDAVELYKKANLNGEASTEVVVSDLHLQPDFIKLIQRVKEIQENEALKKDGDRSIVGDEYEIIDQCNKAVLKLDSEILSIHRFMKDIYNKRFPELESIVYSPLEYIHTVRRLQNHMDVTKTDFSDLLPNTVIMAATVAASMTTGTPLPAHELQQLLRAADEAIGLAQERATVLLYLESRMQYIAPNLSAILGSSLAARILSHAGGLENVARMPSQNLMVLGATRRAAFGFSSATAKVPQGLIYLSELIQGVPPSSRNRAVKYVCGRSALAARVDSFRQCPSGDIGRRFREEIILQVLKHQQPPPAPVKKTLPMPDERKKSQRGGKRYRQMKEKYGISEYRKLANRTKFGPEPEDEVGLHSGVGFGMLGKSTGMGRIKVQMKQQKTQLPQTARKRLAAANRSAVPVAAPNSNANVPGTATVTGNASSLIFTPVQGIELCNPDAVAKPLVPAEKYFSATATFKKDPVKVKN